MNSLRRTSRPFLVAVQQVDEANAAYLGYRQSVRSLDLRAAREATRSPPTAMIAVDRFPQRARRGAAAIRARAAARRGRPPSGRQFCCALQGVGGGWPSNQIIPPIRHPDQQWSPRSSVWRRIRRIRRLPSTARVGPLILAFAAVSTAAAANVRIGPPGREHVVDEDAIDRCPCRKLNLAGADILESMLLPYARGL